MMSDGVMLRIEYDLQGFGIVATSGETGSVERFYLGDEQWGAEERIELEESIVSSQWIAAINWAQSRVNMNLLREEVRSSPEREHGMPLHRPDDQNGYLLN